MLKEILHLWKNHEIMSKAVTTFGEMLTECHGLFVSSWRVFNSKEVSEAESENIHNRDRVINEKEREIRRLLVEHLAMNPGEDASGCLALMSVIKDAERIGDHSKNVYDLAMLSKDILPRITHLEICTEIYGNISQSLKNLSEAFIDSDETMAREILDRYMKTKPLCNKIVQDMFTQDVPKKEAITVVLLARHLKRVNSHTSNVASGIFFPLDKIDFVRAGLVD
ncbi:MAG: hypothetical protein GF350_16155 [Chitinivibrionales bacterium]|nr:hypothetical protein [Chitinivibrionales bacterium]